MSKQNVRIDIYDDDGLKCETVIGKMDGEDIRASMVEALSNEGIPVLRRIVKGKEDNGGEQPRALSVQMEAGNVKFSAFGEVADVIHALGEVLDALEVIEDE